MDYFLKHGKTRLLQILMLKEHSEIMTLVMIFFFCYLCQAWFYISFMLSKSFFLVAFFSS